MSGQSFYTQINLLAITTPDDVEAGKVSLFAKAEGLYAKLPEENELCVVMAGNNASDYQIAVFASKNKIIGQTSLAYAYDAQELYLGGTTADLSPRMHIWCLSTKSTDRGEINFLRSHGSNSPIYSGYDILSISGDARYISNDNERVAEIKFYATVDFTTNNKGTAYSVKTFSAGSGGAFDTRHLISGAGLTRINGGLIAGSVSADPVSVLQSAGSVGAAITFTSGNLTLTAAHFSIVITGSHTITLPSASAATGRIYILANKYSSAVTISSYKDMTGAGNTSIGTHISVILQSDGTYWNQIF